MLINLYTYLQNSVNNFFLIYYTQMCMLDMYSINIHVFVLYMLTACTHNSIYIYLPFTLYLLKTLQK